MMTRSASLDGKGVYFDLVGFEDSLRKLNTPNTPALSLLFALEEQLRSIRDEGLEGRWARHAAMARKTWAWVERMREDRGIGLRVMAPTAFRSPTVTAIEVPEALSAPSLVGAMRERGWVIGGGYGKLKETSIRIGHMGDHSVWELERLLTTLEEVLHGG
jgi:aspartate aminotransferase-like enzyme